MANNKMLIDASHPEETRVAMVRGNHIDEFDFESEHKTQLRGNIYLAKVTRVEPSLQAAFVDYGGNRHGFLAFSEIHPDYYQIPMADRQALLDAEAEDARLAAEDEARQDAENENASSDDDDEQVDAGSEAKTARKRRSRRRGGKKNAAPESDAEASDEAETQASDDTDEQSAQAPQEPASEPVAETTDEESDDDDTSIGAENDDENVVSQAVESDEADAKPKPKRRTSRRKKTDVEAEAPADGAEAAEPASDNTEAVAEDAPKPRRRTSRAKKKVEEAQEPTEASSEASPAKNPVEAQTEVEADAEAPKKRTRRTRKKKSDEDTVQEAETQEAEASGESENGDADGETSETKPKRARSRSRSRRRKADPAETDSSNEDEDGESVEVVGADDALEEVPTRRVSRRHYKIQEVIKRRQILLVQVVKEERGNKGAALTTYLSLAGRYSVLMPNTARGGGISRKITNTADRKRLKGIASKLEVPTGMGVILRTAGASLNSEEIQRDFEYLMRLWENVRTLTLESTAPCLVYEEGSLIKRSIRDLFDKDTNEILVAGEDGYREAQDFMGMLMPDEVKKVKLYKDRVPMFTRMGVEAQLDAMLQPQVTLKSGGYLIIDQTEALVAIDVNSGRSTRQHSVEETATQTNLEAADEVARQLRLRDLAGLIVIDFIDMEERRNVRAVEKRLKDALKNDRARIQVGRISHFGLMEMSRQRIRASVLESTTQVCPVCDGLGHVRSSSSVALAVLRAVEDQLNRNSRHNLTVKVTTETALYLLNSKRESISDLELRFGVAIAIEVDHAVGAQNCIIERGELSNRKPVNDGPVQVDTIARDSDDETAPQQSSSTDQPEARALSDDENGQEGDGRKRRKRRRRKRGGGQSEDGANSASADGDTAEAGVSVEPASAATPESSDADSTADTEDARPKRSTRARRKKASDAVDSEAESPANETDAVEADNEETAANAEQDSTNSRRTSRPRKVKPKAEPAESTETVTADTSTAGDDEEQAPEPPRPPRRNTRRVKSDESEPEVTIAAQASQEVIAEPEAAAASEPEPESSGKSRKGGWWQRKFF